MREYEVMLILPAEADEQVVSTAIDRIAKVVSTDGGEVGTIDRWGRRRFAFEIDHQNEGYYVVANFTADPAVQPELDRDPEHTGAAVVMRVDRILSAAGEVLQQRETS